MRNLLGRLHARRLPELLRVAEAWNVPLYVESKSEVVGALYRAMTDPRTMRDVWERLDSAERAMVIALADAPSRRSIGKHPAVPDPQKFGEFETKTKC